MRKIASVMGLLMLVASMSSYAQEYQPTDKWPFIYEDFKEGETLTRGGEVLAHTVFNVSVSDASLMYVAPDKKIMLPDMAAVSAARVGDDYYVNIRGKMYHMLSETDKGMVVELTTIDQDAMNKTNIGYGISSSSASSYNMSTDMDGRFNLVSQSVLLAAEEKFSGTPLETETTQYLYLGGKLIPASRQEVSSYPGVDKKAAATFFKEEKIKWKETASLEKVLIFVASQLSK